ncbi:hypothetical protein THAOC_01802 [Thalassiosira oceanica]|uniref:Uncharacterized protein n=1 Tax=Thalassiosira oceanica TaxID=159749 RepID=K0THE5_THAOC|nr:hypothetical protein THAOC_01802 [Thalassiosira oceanica]|eukprot:EJK76434.1 hypothetical protein THAOC_01802 [Thalassiosira oceanica]
MAALVFHQLQRSTTAIPSVQTNWIDVRAARAGAVELMQRFHPTRPAPCHVSHFLNLGSWSVVGTCRLAARRKNTATSLDVKLIGWGRTGSAEGRRTGRGLASDALGGWPLRLVGLGLSHFGLEPRDFDLWGSEAHDAG